MQFSVRLISRQPHQMTADDWQRVTADQFRYIKQQYDSGAIRAIYRETGHGVLAIYDVESPQAMDQALAQMPMGPYFLEVSVYPLWDMVPVLQNIE